MLLDSCRPTTTSTSYLDAAGGAGMLTDTCTGKGSPFLSFNCGYSCLSCTRASCSSTTHESTQTVCETLDQQRAASCSSPVASGTWLLALPWVERGRSN